MLARSYAGVGQDVVTKYHVDVVDALVVPGKMAGDIKRPGWGITFGLIEFSAFRVDLSAALEPGVVQEARLTCDEACKGHEPQHGNVLPGGPWPDVLYGGAHTTCVS